MGESDESTLSLGRSETRKKQGPLHVKSNWTSTIERLAN